MMAAGTLVDWSVAVRPMAGEVESGDLGVVKVQGTGALAAVVDGLGHGAEAAAVARKAAAICERYAMQPVEDIIRLCHDELVGTRGAVMSLAYLNNGDGTLRRAGVGNVGGVLLPRGPGPGRPRVALLASGGIVGSALPKLRSQVYPVMPGALLIFASDGIKEGFADGVPADMDPRQLADDILARHGKQTDDALVLVMRYTRGAPQTTEPGL